MDQLLNEGYQQSLYAELIGNIQYAAQRKEVENYERNKQIAFKMLKPSISHNGLQFQCETKSQPLNKGLAHIFGSGNNLYDAINQWYKQYLGI